MAKQLTRLGSIRKSDSFDDQKSASAIADTSIVTENQQEVFESLISQIKRIIHGDSVGDWYSDPVTFFGGDASLKALFENASIGPTSIVIKVKNTSGSVLAKGVCVYIEGGSDGLPTVSLANATTFNKSRLLGVVLSDISNGATGYAIKTGELDGIDTSIFPIGSTLYLSDIDGGLSANKPSDSSFPVIVGVVTKSDAIDGSIIVVPNISQYTRETVLITGWPDIYQYALAFDDSTRTLLLAAQGSKYRWYELGEKFEKLSDSFIISDTEGLHYIYYDKDTIAEIVNPTEAQISEVMRSKTTIAYVYWDAENQKAIYLGYEPHTIGMPTRTHAYLHFTRGAQYLSGLGITDIVTTGSGDVDSDAQFGVQGGACADEDIPFFPIDRFKTDGLPIYYLDGPESAPKIRQVFNPGFSVYPIGSGRLAHNQLDNGVWSLEEVPNRDYVLCHVLATNDFEPLRKQVAFIGQNDYRTLSRAREGARSEMYRLVIGALAEHELIPIATIIFQTGNTYSNAVKARVRSTDTGAPYIDWRRTDIWLLDDVSSAPTFSSSAFTLYDEIDPTKEAVFTTDTLTPLTKRHITLPDKDGTLAYQDDIVFGSNHHSDSDVTVTTTNDSWSTKCSIETDTAFSGGDVLVHWYVNLTLDTITDSYSARLRNSTTTTDYTVIDKVPSSADAKNSEAWSGTIPINLPAGVNKIDLDFRASLPVSTATAKDAYLVLYKR